jgi:hypothetical protein
VPVAVPDLVLVRPMRRAFLVAASLVTVSCASAPVSREAADVCPVHHIRMERKMVWVTYGLIAPIGGPPYIAAMNRDFPYGSAYALGGCDPRPGPRKGPVYVCSQCKKARYDWAVKHPKNPESPDVLAGRPGP